MSRLAKIDCLCFLGLAILIASICIRAYKPYTFLFRDGSFYAQTNRSIGRALTLRQEAFQPRSWYSGKLPWYQNLDVAWSNVSVGSGGEWYPKHSVLMPIFSTPFYLLLGEDGLLCFNALAMLFALFFGYRIGARFVYPEASLVSVFLVASSPLVPYLTYAYSHDVFCAALVASGLWALLAQRPKLGGLILGLSVVAKVTNILLVGPLALAILRRDLKSLGMAALFGAIPLLAYGLANLAMYGSPFVTSYHRVLTVKDGVPTVEVHPFFVYPLVDGLRRFFSTSSEGEVGQMAALPLFLFLGTFFLFRREKGVAVALVVALAAFFVAFGKYRYGGARFFMPWLVLSVTPGASLVEAVSLAFDGLLQHFARLTPSARRLVGLLAFGVLAVSVFVAFFLSRPKPTPSIAEDVERLEVSLDQVPCDYFNMAHKKWECSHLDKGSRYYVGLALEGECEGMERPVLYVPAHPQGRRRVVRWRPEVIGEGLKVVWRWDGVVLGRSPTWTLQVGEGEGLVMEGGLLGEVAQKTIPVRVETGQEVVLTLPDGRDGEVLCVSVEVLE